MGHAEVQAGQDMRLDEAGSLRALTIVICTLGKEAGEAGGMVRVGREEQPGGGGASGGAPLGRAGGLGTRTLSKDVAPRPSVVGGRGWVPVPKAGLLAVGGSPRLLGLQVDCTVVRCWCGTRAALRTHCSGARA